MSSFELKRAIEEYPFSPRIPEHLKYKNPQFYGIVGQFHEYKEDIFVPFGFGGFLKLEPSSGVFVGQLTDFYGQAVIAGGFEQDRDAFWFTKSYGGTTLFNYQFIFEGSGLWSGSWVRNDESKRPHTRVRFPAECKLTEFKEDENMVVSPRDYELRDKVMKFYP